MGYTTDESMASAVEPRRAAISGRLRARGARSVLLVGALVAMALLGIAGCSSSSTGGGQHLEVAAFADEVGKAGVVVVDVRTPSEYTAGHLPSAVNADVEASDFGARIAGLDKSKSYAVYCHSGSRSAVALEQMASAGFAHVVDLAGGVSAWTAQGRSLVTSP
jgi:phage shock protein E